MIEKQMIRILPIAVLKCQEKIEENERKDQKK